MSLNYILIWMVGVSCAAVLVRGLRLSASHYRGWLLVHGLLLLWLGAGLLWFPSAAGYASATAWLIFVLTPSLAMRLVWRWTMQQRYTAAFRLAHLLRLLHPFDLNRHRPALLRAMRLAQRGQMQEALNTLRRLVACGGAAGRAAAAQMFRITGRWEELVEWINTGISPTALLQDVGILMSYLRALGETGDLQRMQWTYAQYGGALENSPHRPSRDFCRMMMLAFDGNTAAVDRLLSETLDWLPVTTQEFWRATAEAAAGQTERSRQRLLRLMEWETDAVARAAIERRLDKPLALGTGTVTEEATGETTTAWLGLGWRTAHMTLALATMNVMMFALELLAGGAEDERVLFQLGALSAGAVVEGDWWRLLTAMFLHAGWLHLSMNLIGLLLLGPFVEASLGGWKFLAIYLFSGLASALFVVAITRAGLIADDLLVGASGGIMGLVGATASVLARHWQAARSRVALQRLRRVALAVGLQVVFDLVTPQVSLAAHSSGVVVGCVVAFLFTMESDS